jgi:hypothetical protein
MTRAAALVIAILALSSCAGVGELRGDQMTITSPRELAPVTLPLTVEWKARDLPSEATGYAVFVDSVPMAPGHGVRSVVDQACRLRRGCPDAAYLRTIGIYLTSDEKVVIPTLKTAGGIGSRADRPAHQVTVVLVDEDGTRVGGYASTQTFRFER